MTCGPADRETHGQDVWSGLRIVAWGRIRSSQHGCMVGLMDSLTGRCSHDGRMVGLKDSFMGWSSNNCRKVGLMGGLTGSSSHDGRKVGLMDSLMGRTVIPDEWLG